MFLFLDMMLFSRLFFPACYRHGCKAETLEAL